MLNKNQYNPHGPQGDTTIGESRGTGSWLQSMRQSSTLQNIPKHPALDYLKPVNRFQGLQKDKGFVKALKGPAAVGQLAPLKPGTA